MGSLIAMAIGAAIGLLFCFFIAPANASSDKVFLGTVRYHDGFGGEEELFVSKKFLKLLFTAAWGANGHGEIRVHSDEPEPAWNNDHEF